MSDWLPRHAYDAFRRSSGMRPTPDGQEIRLGSSSPSLYMVPGDDVPAVCSGCGAELHGAALDSPAGWLCSSECPEIIRLWTEMNQKLDGTAIFSDPSLIPFSETGLDAPS